MDRDSKQEILEEYVERSFKDLGFFAQEFLSHLLVKDVPSFHRDLYEMLPKEDRLVIAAPRGFAKSTVSSVIYPVFLGISGIWKKEVVIVSASETLAVELLRKVKKEFELNQKILQFFGNLKTDKWSESHFVLKSGVSFRARGVGGQIRGFRPDCLILDDMETNESVVSEEQRKKLKDWLLRDCINSLTVDGQLILIGTIIHPLSVLSDLLAVDNGWLKRKYAGYVDGIQEEGHELWPALWPHHRLQAKKKEIGSFAFASEIMNDPVSDETSPIKENQIRYWKELPQQMSLVIAVDPAYSEEETSDFKVASLVGIDTQLNRYLVSYVRTHAPTGSFIDSILNLWLQHRSLITGIGIPNSGTEKEFFKSFVDKANQRKLYPPVTELKNTFVTQAGQSKRNKKDRIVASLQPLFEAGKYYINASHLEARDEILTVGSSRWDDLVDSMAYAEQILTPSFAEAKQEVNRFSGKFSLKSKSNYGLEY